MNQQIRVVHYLNQFFAQIGGEDKGEVGPQSKPVLSEPVALFSRLWAKMAKSLRQFFAAIIFLPNNKRRRSTR